MASKRESQKNYTLNTVREYFESNMVTLSWLIHLQSEFVIRDRAVIFGPYGVWRLECNVDNF